MSQLAAPWQFPEFSVLSELPSSCYYIILCISGVLLLLICYVSLLVVVSGSFVLNSCLYEAYNYDMLAIRMVK